MNSLIRKVFGIKATLPELRATEQSLKDQLEKTERKIQTYYFIAGRAISENDRASAETAWSKNKKLKARATQISNQLVRIQARIENIDRDAMLEKAKDTLQHLDLESNMTLTSQNKEMNEIKRVMDFMLEQTDSSRLDIPDAKWLENQTQTSGQGESVGLETKFSQLSLDKSAVEPRADTNMNQSQQVSSFPDNVQMI